MILRRLIVKVRILYDRRITMFVTVCACRGLKKIKIFRIVELDKPSLNLIRRPLNSFRGS